MLTFFRNLVRHPERAECGDTEATLSALIKPSPRTSQSESFRAATGAAMLREFDRATAPTKDATRVVPVGDDTPEVVVVDGVALAHLDPRTDPSDDADAVLRIIAKHRAITPQ